MSYTTDASRWRALSIRDPSAANAFVYTVKSTRVYCRPTCPARLARRANVGFCATPAEAAALGFRACKRCKPDAAITEDPQEKAVARACALIDGAIAQGDKGKQGLRLQELAKKVGLTPRYLHKIFKERMGVTPREWARGKMGEGEDKREGEMRTPSLVLDSPLELGEFFLDGFDFNELVDFDADAGMAVDGVAEPAIALWEGFDEPFDVNATMLTWDTFAPDYLGSGFRLDDKVSKWADAALIPDAEMMKTSTTFEQDAALILDMGRVPSLNDPPCVNTLG
jgi:methylphosphotriester-DNA--protein-cysteine methyltransferase